MVAEALGCPLDVLPVRKIGAPGHSEYAMGALASGGTIVLNESAIQSLSVPADQLADIVEREQAELLRQEAVYHDKVSAISVRGKRLVVVDDGIATGETVRAAAKELLRRGATQIVVAAPVGAPESIASLAQIPGVDVVCVQTPSDLHAVGQFYDEFEAATDDDVNRLLAESRADGGANGDDGDD